jgi:hypothetical protein
MVLPALYHLTGLTIHTRYYRLGPASTSSIIAPKNQNIHPNSTRKRHFVNREAEDAAGDSSGRI